MSSALLIPSYEPKMRVADYLLEFSNLGFDHFLVVDDGSGKEYDEVFEAIEKNTKFEVIRYGKNKGKGHALKTGLRYLLDKFKDLDFVVTADSDGQHLSKDIENVRKACISYTNELVLGVRDFSKAPKKSQNGNLWSSRYFRIVTGTFIKDTQTGLRGVPSCLFRNFLKTPGNRFEFEMRFLLDVASACRIEQVDIETVYEDGNEGSHFRPLQDSFRIASGLMVYATAATFFIVLNILLFALLRANVFIETGSQSPIDLLYCNLIAMGGAGLLIYIVLQPFAFNNRVFFLKSLTKTLSFLILMALIQYGCTLPLASSYPWSVVVVSILSLVFGGVKIVLDYRFAFAMKKIK